MFKANKAEIKGKIKAFSTNRDALRNLGHEILMNILYHAAPKELSEDASGSGDATLALAFIKEMPTSWAEQALKWLNEFSPIRVQPQRDVCGLAVKYKEITVREEKLAWWHLEAAAETPFYEFVKEREVQLIGEDAIKGFYMSQAKAWQKKVDDNKIEPKALPAALALIESLKGGKLTIVEATAPEAPEAPEAADPAIETAKAA